MKRNLLYLIALFILLAQTSSSANAATYSGKTSLSAAIKKYKGGNYTGCLQDTQLIVKNDPSNALAYYYMAISYVQAGKQKEAIDAYSKVMTLKPNTTLFKYANTGKMCLEDPTKCALTSEQSDLDKAINSPFSDGLSDKVRLEIENKKLDAVKNKMNAESEINNYDFKKFENFKTDTDSSRDLTKVADNLREKDSQPTNDEIVAALKVLNKAGLNPYGQIGANPYMSTTQSPEAAQLSMLMGGGSQQANPNSAMLNMLPFMMAQSKTGNGDGSNPYSPELVQTMLMNSMLPDFNFNTDKDK